HALKSLRGGTDQYVYRDFPIFKTARNYLQKDTVPASVIAVLMNSTRLHVYHGCYGV
ncbi:hypothetical protein PHYSODRAFT_466524, partial [Phytophthora sojae]